MAGQEPLHQKLMQFIERAISSGEYKIGDLLPGEQDLMNKFGVSRGTVRKAYDSLVFKGFVERRSGQGSFVRKKDLPEENIRRMKIGIIVPSHEVFNPNRDPLNYEHKLDVFNGVLAGASLCNAEIELVPYKPELKTSSPRDGYIILDSYRELVNAFNERNVPYSFYNLDGIISGVQHGVSVDLNESLYEAIKYLFSQGHRRVAMIDNGSMGAYHSVLNEYCLPFEESLVALSWKGTEEEAYEATLKLLSEARKPDAIFCRSDIRAAGALKCLHDKGINVPGEISVMGFDNIHKAKELSLSSYDTRRYDAGYEAIKVLSSLLTEIKEHGRMSFQITHLKGRIVERSTVAKR